MMKISRFLCAVHVYSSNIGFCRQILRVIVDSREHTISLIRFYITNNAYNGCEQFNSIEHFFIAEETQREHYWL